MLESKKRTGRRQTKGIYYDFKWRQHLDLPQVHCAKRAKEKSQDERQLTTEQANTGNGLWESLVSLLFVLSQCVPYTLQHGGFVPRESLAEKCLLELILCT